MSEPRSLVFPQAIGLAARPMTMTDGRAVLSVSAFHAFRLSDGGHVMPATWYETVATRVGADIAPDSMVPLPGAELLVLGPIPGVQGDARKVSLRCGQIFRDVTLFRDPERPGEPFVPDFNAAVWHAEENPEGREGPEDDRKALIRSQNNPANPIWFGPTPLDHPTRLRNVGKPDATSGTGWPPGTDQAVFYESHPGFWTRSFSPGDPLAFDGLADKPLDTQLPAYRMTICSGHEDGGFKMEPARIQCVTLIPCADVGAVFWRLAIELGDDILGLKIQALIAALEDVDAPVKDHEHWGRLAYDRWLKPDTGFDDRPFLPAALAATVTLPFGMAEDDPIKERHAAAEAWLKNEVGMEEDNPFGELVPEEDLAIAQNTIDASEADDTALPNADDIGAMASGALAASKKRHEEAGFKRKEGDDRKPEKRGPRLAQEIQQRLSRPYQSERDKLVVNAIRKNDIKTMTPREIMNKLAQARRISPNGGTTWPMFVEDEARVFGDAFYVRLERKDPRRHLDVAGAALISESAEITDGEDLGNAAVKEKHVTGRRFDGLFAEDTLWKGVKLTGCAFIESSLVRARFEACEFTDCEFRDTNMAMTEIVGCTFVNCTFAQLRMDEPTWYDNRFERCTFEDISMSNLAMSDSSFLDGSWTKFEMADGLVMDVEFKDMTLEEVTFAEIMVPRCRFERVKMTKFWMLGQGPAGSTFEDVEGETCGFMGGVRFDGATFNLVRFEKTGFTDSFFPDVTFQPNCRFYDCDLSGVLFLNTVLDGVRFIQCPLVRTMWNGASATDAWFFGALLRGVDFGDTELRRAVFTDADLEGVKFLPDKTIGADFKGTVLAEPDGT